jgi:nicotinamide mononucleotide transporter
MKSFKGLTKFEKIWLIIFSSVIVITTFYFSITGTKYNDWKSIALNFVISPISALTGVFCVVLCAKGNISNWTWGLINSILYGLVAWVSGYYGDWILNWFFFIPTQFIIFFVWRNRIIDKNIGIVKMLKASITSRIILLSIIILFIIGFAYFLTSVDSWFSKAMARNSVFYEIMTNVSGIKLLGALMDSSSVIIQVMAEILLILCLAEQWPLWIMTNVISIVIWGMIIIKDPTSYSYSIPTMVMWIAFLINSIYGTYVWFKNGKRNV